MRAVVLVLGALIACLALSSTSVAAEDAAERLRSLVPAARESMAERIEPPASRLPFPCLAERSWSAPLREYVLGQQAEALDALLATATTPDATREVERLLGELAREGISRAAGAWLSERADSGPARIRQAAAFGELPAALNARMHAGCDVVSYLGLLGRSYRPLGELALGDYRQAAEQEVSNPWTWLALAWLAGREGELPLKRSLAASSTIPTSDARRARLFAQQQLAWLRLHQGRPDDARAEALKAMELARQEVDRLGTELDVPAAEQAWRDLGQTGTALAAVLQTLGQDAAARDVLSEMLPLQERIAALRSDDLPAQYALIETLQRRALLQSKDLASSEAALQAMNLYQDLLRRVRYDPMRCDFDARWRVDDLYGGDDVWRDAVRALMARSDLAAMDLRGFGPEHQGCVFELHALLDLVPAQRIALIVDASTRREFLDATVRSCLAGLSPSSPNFAEPGHITLLDAGAGETSVVRELMRMA
jgi:tetratricopeptide (TPR) repeat protein